MQRYHLVFKLGLKLNDITIKIIFISDFGVKISKLIQILDK